MSLIHRKFPLPKPQAAAPFDPFQTLTLFGPDNPSHTPFLPGHTGMKTGRTQRSRADIIRKFLESTKRSMRSFGGLSTEWNVAIAWLTRQMKKEACSDARAMGKG